jgi:tetratricopeptide (TPR) repeat protein
MTRENLLFAIIGLLLGFIVGFMFASSMSQKTAPSAASSTLPADHPPLGSNGQSASSAPNPQAMQAEVTAQLEKARNEPKNFDAQVKAAQLYFQIQRYDQAIEYLLKANQIRPDNVDAVAMLGDVNLQAGRFDEALNWYQAALKKKPGDVSLLASVAYTQLQKGDAKGAEDAIAQLEKADPSVSDLPRFKERLAELKR